MHIEQGFIQGFIQGFDYTAINMHPGIYVGLFEWGGGASMTGGWVGGGDFMCLNVSILLMKSLSLEKINITHDAIP